MTKRVQTPTIPTDANESTARFGFLNLAKGCDIGSSPQSNVVALDLIDGIYWWLRTTNDGHHSMRCKPDELSKAVATKGLVHNANTDILV